MTDFPLEPDRRAMEEMGRRALDLVADFVDGLPDAAAANVDDIEPRLAEYLPPPGEVPGDFGALLDRFPEAAAQMIARDRARGLRPFLLVASAGTTSTGAVDPIGELARLACSEGLWNHVDAAYGGFFQLTERGRSCFAGIEHADSVVLDPHKGLFLPHGTGILLVRSPAAVRAAHAVDRAYLQDLDADQPLPDYAELGPELTRDYLGLGVWLPLHLHGIGAFRRALDEKLDLAAWAHRALSADPALELPWEPELSIVPFRLHGDESTDGDNKRLLERIHATRRLYLSSTRIDGRQLLRLCIISHRTHRPDVEDAVEIIREAVASGVPAR